MTYYRFNNSKGEHFDMLFENAEQAFNFAYHFGYCFMGRTSDFQKGYFEKRSKANIEKMVNSKNNKEE